MDGNSKERRGLTTRELTYAALGAVLMSVCAWVSIPSAVPFTMQTFAVFCVLFVMGPRLGTLSVAVYLMLGAVGAPVFSNFTGGLGSLLGPTGGYLVGFLFQGLIYGAVTKVLGCRPFAEMLAMAAGLAALYLFGTVWFVFVYSGGEPIGFAAALSKCVIPFIIPDLAKLALARAASQRIPKPRDL